MPLFKFQIYATSRCVSDDADDAPTSRVHDDHPDVSP